MTSTGPDIAIGIRPAEPADCHQVLLWANDPQTRAMSFHCDAIPVAEHERWYAESLEGDRRRLMIAEIDQRPIGFIRFDSIDPSEQVAEISINLAPNHRGHRLAQPVLLAAKRVAAEQGLQTLIARIRANNEPSIRAFEAAGFAFVSDEKVSGIHALRYETVVPEKDRCE